MDRFHYCLWLPILTFFFFIICEPAYARSIELKLGHVSDAEWPIGLGITEFAKMVETESRGSCAIKVFPEGKLGSAVDLLKMVKVGNLDLALIPASVLASYAKEIGVLGMPFVFRTYEDADRFIEGSAGDAVLRALSEIGIIGLSYYELGMIDIATNAKPIRNVQDYKGLKVLINSSEIVLSSIRLLGATPSITSPRESYHALQRGMGDSILTSVLFYDLRHYKDVAPNLSITHQFYSLHSAH